MNGNFMRYARTVAAYTLLAASVSAGCSGEQPVAALDDVVLQRGAKTYLVADYDKDPGADIVLEVDAYELNSQAANGRAVFRAKDNLTVPSKLIRDGRVLYTGGGDPSVMDAEQQAFFDYALEGDY